MERGLHVNPLVKASLAPGSRVVTDYLNKTGLQPYLDKLGFNLVGYGCTTCIGNSGPLPTPVDEAITKHDLVAASVLSGNRNFEARVHQSIKANFLMSPPLVVAFALAGRVDIDLTKEPLGRGKERRRSVPEGHLADAARSARSMQAALKPEVFRNLYRDFAGAESEMERNSRRARATCMPGTRRAPTSRSRRSSRILDCRPGTIREIKGARALGIFGDSVTTDHISPAGSIKKTSPAGKYLLEHGVPFEDFNSYGSRRGNDRVMTRGTFANVRIKNLMAPGTEGGVTKYQPGGEGMSIFDAAMKYAEHNTPLMVVAGQEYGTGSSRDWAAKGTALLGVKAVVAQSFERIHRSNLVGMGVLPLQFNEGTTAQTLKLDGTETYDVVGLNAGLKPQQELTLRITRANGQSENVPVRCRIDTPIEIDYYQHGGILPFVLRQLVGKA